MSSSELSDESSVGNSGLLVSLSADSVSSESVSYVAARRLELEIDEVEGAEDEDWDECVEKYELPESELRLWRDVSMLLLLGALYGRSGRLGSVGPVDGEVSGGGAMS
jgi:hypothetical protein